MLYWVGDAVNTYRKRPRRDHHSFRHWAAALDEGTTRRGATRESHRAVQSMSASVYRSVGKIHKGHQEFPTIRDPLTATRSQPSVGAPRIDHWSVNTIPRGVLSPMFCACRR